MAIRAVAFDLDGTLVDSIPDLTHASNHARMSLGLAPLPAAVIETYVGDGPDVMVARALANDIQASYTGTPEQERALAAFDEHYLANLTANTDFYTGMKPVLEALHQRGYPLALATNKPERYTLRILERLGVAPLFTVVVGGDTLATRKPDAGPLQHIARQLGIAPAELLMVGDSKNDALTARNAGCPVYLVAHGYADPRAFDCDRVVEDPAELLTLLPLSPATPV